MPPTETTATNEKTDLLLLEEYKLIQAKIDKFGEDKFKVRSWCFTLLTGGAVAVKYLGLLDNSSFSPCILFLFLPAVGAFHLVELRQRQISKRLGFRAAAIERIWRSIGFRGNNRTATPQLASHLIKIGREEDARYLIRTKLSAAIHSLNEQLYCERLTKTAEEATPRIHFRASSQKVNKPEQPYSLIQCLIVNSEDIFYFVQYALVIVFAVFLTAGANLQKSPLQKHEVPEMKENVNDLNVDGTKPTSIGESK